MCVLGLTLDEWPRSGDCMVLIDVVGIIELV